MPEPVITPEYENTNLALYHRIKHHQIEMLQDRGYVIDKNEENVLSMKTKQFVDYYDRLAQPTTSFVHALSKLYSKPQQENIYVYFYESSGNSVGIDPIKELINLMYIQNYNHLILITNVLLSDTARKAISNVPSLRIEIFLFGQMVINPTKHFFVPHHRKASPEEKQQIYSKLNGGQIPQITTEDPIVRWYGFLPGIIVHIDRKNLSTHIMVNDTVSYRVVVDEELKTKKSNIIKKSRPVREKKGRKKIV